MIKMHIAGITIKVPADEVSFYKQAGYSVVDEAPAPVAPVPEQAPIDPEPSPIEPDPAAVEPEAEQAPEG